MNGSVERSIAQLNGMAAAIHQRQERFIESHDAQLNELVARADGHSLRIDGTAMQIMRWKAQARVILSIASFVGFSGLVSTLAVLWKLSGR